MIGATTRIDYPPRTLFNAGMNIKSQADIDLINALGGPAAVARLLGFPRVPGTQRVHNWLSRGRIPSDVKLLHPDIFLRHLSK